MSGYWNAHSDRDFEDQFGPLEPQADDEGNPDDEPHMPLRAWIADTDWSLMWRVLMDDIGVSREGDYPYCLTPWM